METTHQKLRHIITSIKSNDTTLFFSVYDDLVNISYINEATAILCILHDNLEIFKLMLNYGVDINWCYNIFAHLSVSFNRINFIECITYMTNCNGNDYCWYAYLHNNVSIIEQYIKLGLTFDTEWMKNILRVKPEFIKNFI